MKKQNDCVGQQLKLFEGNYFVFGWAVNFIVNYVGMTMQEATQVMADMYRGIWMATNQLTLF